MKLNRCKPADGSEAPQSPGFPHGRLVHHVITSEGSSEDPSDISESSPGRRSAAAAAGSSSEEGESPVGRKVKFQLKQLSKITSEGEGGDDLALVKTRCIENRPR